MRERLIIVPMLSLPDNHDNFIVYSNVSDIGLGYILMQRGKVIAGASRQLKVHLEGQ